MEKLNTNIIKNSSIKPTSPPVWVETREKLKKKCVIDHDQATLTNSNTGTSIKVHPRILQIHEAAKKENGQQDIYNSYKTKPH
jgi:hypothetical protein